MMRNYKTVLCIALGFLLVGTTAAQSDFEKYKQQQQKAFDEHKQKKRKDFAAYRDSLNREYARFLETKWKAYNLQKPEPPIKKPIPIPPVYDEDTPQPEPVKIPTPEPPVAPVSIPDPVAPIVPDPEPHAPEPQLSVKTVFFGTDIRLQSIAFPSLRLSGVSERDIANYWRSLVNTPYHDILNETKRIKAELQLNDWGLYQLLGKVFKAYAPGGSANEQVVFEVFMLNQLGYRAKIGRCGNELIPLIAFANEVTNCMYFRYGTGAPVNYYTINPSHKDLRSVETCPIDYAEAQNSMNLQINTIPKFTVAPITKTLVFENKPYALKIDKNIVDFYRDYPCVEFSVYAEAPLDPITYKSIDAEIAPKVINKSQTEAVNWLLHFVQKAFEYKTDDDQFSYEKFFFAEETIESSFSDCEDRSILFAQLVRNLLKMPVVLVYYPGVHLATAVKFNDTSLAGDYIMVNGDKYLICDPTYINADLGLAMPQLKYTPVKVYNVR